MNGWWGVLLYLAVCVFVSLVWPRRSDWQVWHQWATARRMRRKAAEVTGDHDRLDGAP